MAFYIGAFALPSAVVWGGIGAIVQALGEFPLQLALFAHIFAICYGLAETIGMPLRPLGLAWQVPARWVKGKPLLVRIVTWGVLLGPGLATRNPYAGMWLLPLLIGLGQSLATAILVGIAHGGARGIGIVCNMEYCMTRGGDGLIWGTVWHWRLAHGLALLACAGALGVCIAWLIIPLPR